MKKLTVILFVLGFGTANAQSLQGGYSFRGWAQNPKHIGTSIEYKDVRLMYIVALEIMPDEYGDKINRQHIGLFYAPDIKIKSFIAEPLIGVMDKKYPNDKGKRIHFGINIRKPITDNLSIYYQHISNGWLGKINPGLDTIGLRISPF